jgi:hypothetical protein
MPLETVPTPHAWGKPLPDYSKFDALFRELQGYKMFVVQGQAAAQNIAVPNILTTDTLRHVIRFKDGQITQASVVTGVVGNNNAIRWTSKVHGQAGNMIAVVLKDPGAASQALSVSVSGSVITVSLATDGASAITSTASDVITAVNGDADASALVSAANEGASNGTGVVVAVAETHLAGGVGGMTLIDDLVAEASIPSDGNVQLSTTDTSKDLLLIVFNDKSGS